MKFSRGKKIILGILLAAAILATWVSNSALAVGFDTLMPPPFPNDAGGTAFMAASGAGWILAVVARLVNFGIALGTKVLDLEAVKTGWKMALSFTNLGFVLAIIIIAFATIFRLQSYAMKQTLWKLIVAALLVNFSLVIAGAFISVSNIVTDVFLQATTADSLSNALGNAMQPQKFWEGKETTAWSLATGGISYLIKYIISLLFIAVFTFLMILAFFTLFIMLLVRAIALIFLLILSPIVWLFWIFPSTVKYWQKWWTEFIRWNFFAPAVLFFVYLTVVTSQNLNQIGKINELDPEAAAKIQEGLLLKSGIFQHSANLLVLVALLFGGIYLANQFGVAGGSLGVKWAQKAGKSFGGWVGKKGVRLGTLPFRGAAGQKFIEGMQKLGAKPGVGGFFARHTVGRLGNVLSGIGVQQGEKLINQAAERQKKLSDKQLALQVSTMSRDERTVALTRLAKNKNLNLVPDMTRYIANPKTKKIFESYGKKKEYEDMEKTAGFNTAMLTGKDEKGKPISRAEATKKFMNSYDIKDYDKLQGNILSAFHSDKNNLGLSQADHEEIRNLVRQSVFDVHPGAISKIRVKLKGDNLRDFQGELDKYISTFEKDNLPDNLKGINTPIKAKLKFINDNKSQFSNWARGIYGSQKNFGGSLFGGYTFTPVEKEEST